MQTAMVKPVPQFEPKWLVHDHMEIAEHGRSCDERSTKHTSMGVHMNTSS
jgi:hypothetical protein